MAGRPKAKIDWRRVDQMLMAQCDGVTIADSLGIHPDSLYRACDRDHKMTFTAYSQQKRSKGVATAREVFYKQAWIDKNDGQQATRQIFWLKNHAGFSDRIQTEISGEIKTQNTIEVVRAEFPNNGTETAPPLPPSWQANTGGKLPG